MERVHFLVLVNAAAALWSGTSSSSELRGHMQPLGQHRPGPEDTIDEYNGSLALSSETFFNEYVSKRRPVVIRGAALDMPAFSLWTDEYLDSKFGQLEIRLEEKVEGESNDRLPAGKFGIGRDTLGNFLSGYQEPESNGYIVGELPEAMYKDVNIIPCVACSSLYNKIQEVNFWMTSKGAASAIHRDAFDAINCLFSGRKEWFFMDSHYNDEVYVVHRAKYELGGLSLVNPRAVDLEQFPKFAEVKYAFLTVNPGDCLYIPSGYYHQVKSPGGRNMAVSVLFSKMPRNVQLNTCTDGQERSKPLAGAGVYLPYPGTGVMRMGTLDLEFLRTLVNNFTLRHDDRLNEQVLQNVLADLQAPAEGYESSEETSAEEASMLLETADRVFRILNTEKKSWLSVAELDALPVSTWLEAVLNLEPVDISNTYDFEYSIVSATAIMDSVDEFFESKTDIGRSEWIKLYTQSAGGSEYIGLKVFNDINPEKRETLSEEEFREGMSNILQRFESEDPRLDVGESENELIHRRALGSAHDSDDSDDGDEDRDEEERVEEDDLLDHVEL